MNGPQHLVLPTGCRPYFAVHLNHVEHLLYIYKVGYITVSFCCQALVFLCLLLQFWLQFTCVHIYIRYVFLNHIEYLFHVSSFCKALNSICVWDAVLWLQYTYYKIYFTCTCSFAPWSLDSTMCQAFVYPWDVVFWLHHQI